MRAWIATIVVIIVGAVVYGWLFLRESPTAAQTGGGSWRPPPPVVEIAEVQVGSIAKTIEAVGTLRANESITVRPEISGRIDGIYFNEGEPVRVGDQLVSLEASIYQAEVEEKLADKRLSELNFRRADELLRKNVSSVNERDQALAQLQSDEAALSLARARLQKTKIAAPFDGILGLRRVSIGDFVSAGQDLVDLVQITPIKVDFRVGEVFLGRLAPGQGIEVTADAFPDESFKGEVYAIEPTVDVNGRAVIIRARIPNPGAKLRPGLFARVRLIVERAADALLVPEDAIVPSKDQHFVYRVIDGRAVLTEVELGKRENAMVEVRSGLERHDVVVTAGQLKLRDGIAIDTGLPRSLTAAGADG
jgi:membrane fusion protein (multidrug efflux system)